MTAPNNSRRRNLSQDAQTPNTGHLIRANSDGDQAQPTDSEAFQSAIQYLTKLKARFANDPDVYQRFLDILQMHHRQEISSNDVRVRVQTLFEDEPDLFEELENSFLPDASDNTGGRGEVQSPNGIDS